MSASAASRGGVVRAMALAAIAVFLLDRVSKVVVIDVLDLPHHGIMPVASPYLTFIMAWNTGINFGLFGDADARWLLVALALGVSVGVGWWMLRRGDARLAWAGGVLIGGAVGNAWDRVQYGAVADFLNMSCCGIQNPYAFNVADVAIFAGAVWLAWKA